MQKHSNVSDSPFERDKIADDLYNRLGAEDAKHRESINANFGTKDLLQTISGYLNLREGQTVFDIGCGSGKHLQHFAELVGDSGKAVGLDFSIDAVNNTKKLGLTCFEGDGSTLPFEKESANAINCAYAIYYFSDVTQTIQEFFRVLKASGKLVICGPSLGTNKELYNFHTDLTGKSPSDADLMAIGYVQEKVAPLITETFGSVNEFTFKNKINFPSHEDFINYWQSTSLVRRTLTDSERLHFSKIAKEQLSEKYSSISITKMTSIISVSKLP